MKAYVRRVLARLSEAEVLTHTLPYQARIAARRG